MEDGDTKSGPQKLLVRYGAWLLYLILFLAPGYVFFQSRGGVRLLQGADLKVASLLLFPLAGLYALFFVWVQVIIGPNIRYLRRHYPRIDRFHRREGLFALTFAFVHPLLLLVGVGLTTFLNNQFVSPRFVLFALLGKAALLMVTVAVLSALLRRQRWLLARWRYFHFLNYLVFAAAWVHSWFLGSDVQPTSLKYLWIFFAFTAVVFSAQRLRTVVIPSIIQGFKNLFSSRENIVRN